MNLYILEYNNYYNRILKKKTRIENYQQYVIHTLSNANFNPADGINTQHVFGSNVNAYDGKGDYLVAVDSENKIVSRWFILECVRSRAGQWTLDLYRDVLADFYDQAFNSTAFIEKGLIQSLDDPAIYNKEDMTFNQIKKSEYVFSDLSRCKWIAMYIDDSFPNTKQTFVNENSRIIDIVGNDGSDIYNYLEGSGSYIYSNPHNKIIRYIYNVFNYLHREFRFNVDNNEIVDDDTYQGQSTDYAIINNIRRDVTNLSSIFSDNKGSLSSNMMGIYNDVTSTDISRDYLTPKIFYNQNTGKTYKVQAVYKGAKAIGRDIMRNSGPAWDDYVRVARAIISSANSGTINNDCQYASTEITFDTYQIRMTEIFPKEQLNLTIPNTRNKTIDLPYDLVLMPYSEEPVVCISEKEGVYAEPIPLDGTASMFIAQELARRFGSGADKHIYDIQLLPFCNIPSVFKYSHFAITKNMNENSDYATVTNNDGDIKTIMYFASSCECRLEGDLAPYMSELPTVFTEYNSIYDKKLSSETTKYRYCSGDYSSSFEFNKAFGASIRDNVADLSYKPYNPYIRLAPKFSNLFGGEFHDGRGLVCSGDYSISTVTDQFQNYKLQNINFQRSFDRQIQNMEVQQKYSRIQDITGAITGTFTGAAAGGLAGSNFGPAGAAIGAGAGALASGIGGIADVYINDKLRAEAIDYTKDQFGYELGNIKALPNTLNKVDSFNPDNKIWPTMEVYECTEIEKEAFQNKIRYNGCKIMRIGKPKDFINASNFWLNSGYEPSPAYLKAKIIKIDDLGEDFHVVKQISEELNKGVFVEYIGG